jgi:heptose-I-phosphate ethanolaminephosphotransferase
LAPFYFATAIDLFLMATFGNRLSSGYVSIAITDSAEAGEFLAAYARPVLLSFAVMAGVYALGMFAVRRVRIKARPRWSLACASLLASVYGALVVQGLATGWSLKDTVLDILGKEMSAPVGSAFQAGLALEILGEENELKRRRAQNSLGARPSRSNDNEVYVWVVGESSRPENWSLFGYPRETSPRAIATAGIIPLPHVHATAPLTSIAVPSMLSLWPITDWNSIVSHRSVVSAFGEAGFATYWLSSQEADTWGGVIPQIATEAKRRWYFDRAFDGAMLERFRTLLDSAAPGEKLFIVIHTKGSHFIYSRRYPPAFAQFNRPAASQRDQLVDMYDNTILYTDWFVGEVISLLKERGGPAAMVYSSDHGENLLDDDNKAFGHGIGNKHDLSSAAFVWLSDPLRDKFPEMVKSAEDHASAKLSLSNLPHSLLDLAGIEVPELDRSLSIFSPTLGERERWHLVRGTLVSEFDKIFQENSFRDISENKRDAVIR